MPPTRRSLPVQRTERRRVRRENASPSNPVSDINSIINDLRESLNPGAHAMMTTHMRLLHDDRTGQEPSSELKDRALSVLYNFPDDYCVLRAFYHLPTLQQLNEHAKQFPVYPGLNRTVLNELKEKCASLPLKDRVVSISFDETSLAMDHAEDPKCSTTATAKNALVCMIRWLKKPIKQVLGYWVLDSGIDSKTKHTIIKNAIAEVNENNLIVKALLLAPNPKNLTLFTEFNVSPEKPFFNVTGDDKIFFIFDPLHSLKLMRDSLLENDLHYRDGTVSWKVLRKIYTMSLETPLSLLTKISDAHFNLNDTSKLSATLVAQVFSNEMSLAYGVYRYMKPQEFEKDDTTGLFLDDLVKWFDTLNSKIDKIPDDKRFNYAMSVRTKHENFLKEMLVCLEKSHFITENGDGKLPGLEAMRLTTISTLELYSEALKKYSLPCLKTCGLNLNALRKSFIVIRRNNSSEGLENKVLPTPSLAEFEAGIRTIFTAQLKKALPSISNRGSDNLLNAKMQAITNLFA